MANRVGGIIFFKVGGVQLQAKGAFTYNLGIAEKSEVVGSDGFHGYKEEPKAPFIEGAITDSPELDVAALQQTTDTPVTLELSNGKVVQLDDAFYSGEGDANTEEGEIAVKFVGSAAREV